MKIKNTNIENEFYLSQWIEGNLADTELKKLVSEDDFLAYKKLKKGIEVFCDLEQPLDTSFERILHRMDKKTKIRKLHLKWIASIAAMLLFFMGFYALINNNSVLNKSSFGEQKTIALLDNSKVILNAKSALNYSKKGWKNKREVFLNGEAFFQVEKGSTFTVKTKNGNITVLGTQFNVKSTDTFFEVICYEGKVRVVHNNKEYILNPTNSFRKINKNPIESLNYSRKKPTWTLGESTYRSVPLKYVIEDLEKQFNIQINSAKINNSSIYTGSFNHHKMDLAFKSVFDAMGLKYNKTASNIYILDN